jgi:hypothetical protein
MRTRNIGNSTVANIWADLVECPKTSGYVKVGAVYTGSTNLGKQATFSVEVYPTFLQYQRGEKLDKTITLAKCNSYDATIRKLVYCVETDSLEHWVNDYSYSVTTSKHQSECNQASVLRRKSENTFKFDWMENIYSLSYVGRYSGRYSQELVNEVAYRLDRAVQDLHKFINTPRRQSQTIKRKCQEYKTKFEDMLHCLPDMDYAVGTRNVLEDYITAVNGTTEFDGDKHVFNAVYALIND